MAIGKSGREVKWAHNGRLMARNGGSFIVELIISSFWVVVCGGVGLYRFPIASLEVRHFKMVYFRIGVTFGWSAFNKVSLRDIDLNNFELGIV